MYVIPLTGQVLINGSWHPCVEISKIDADKQSPDDRVFLKEPIPVPGANYSRKSFKRSEIQKYKPS